MRGGGGGVSGRGEGEREGRQGEGGGRERGEAGREGRQGERSSEPRSVYLPPRDILHDSGFLLQILPKHPESSGERGRG